MDAGWLSCHAKPLMQLRCLKEKLADGGKNAGVAELIAKSIQKNLKVLVNGEMLEVYREIVILQSF